MTIISMVTLSLLVALTIGNKIVKEAGTNSLSKQEKEIVIRSGYDEDDIESIELQIKSLFLNK